MLTRQSIFQKYYKLVGIGLSKQQKLDANRKAIISFIRNISRTEGAKKFSLSLNNRKKQFQIFQKEQLKYYYFISF